MKTNDLQIIIFTTIATDINLTIKNLYLFAPVLFPKNDTQIMSNETTEKIHTITYVSWYTEHELSINGNVLQVDIGSAQQVISPKYLFGSFQRADRIAAPNENNNIAIFDNVNVRKYFCQIDGYSYPGDAVPTNFLRMII